MNPREKKINRPLVFGSLAVLIVVLAALDVRLGSVSYSFAQLREALFSPDGDQVVRSIVLKFRLPKMLVAVTAGAALSAAGLQMQTLFRNPLAGPFVLGISSGASLGVALFLMGIPLLGIGTVGETFRSLGMAGAAWVGSALILLVVMSVSSRLKDIMAVLILGMMFGSAAGAIVDVLQYFSSEGSLKSFVVWTMGSLGGVSATQLRIMIPVCAVGLLLSVLLIKPLNMMLLGENYARTMGMKVSATRYAIFISTVLLAGTVTAFCGPIGFIGLAVPHVARMIFLDADHRVLMPASIMLGSAAMLFCDIVSQLPGYDMVLPINTITALLGIPVVVIIIARNRKIF